MIKSKLPIILFVMALGTLVACDAQTISEKSAETEKETVAVTETEEPAPTAQPETEEECYTEHKMTFTLENILQETSLEYPCGWTVETQNNTVKITSPDNQQAFTFPSPDFGYEESTILTPGTADVSGKTYETTRFTLAEAPYVTELVKAELGKYEYSIILRYLGETRSEELEHILSTFEYTETEV